MLYSEFARNGGLMAYGPNVLTLFRQGGVQAAKILHEAKPAEMPIEAPTKFEFVLNLRTAAQLGINLPASVLRRRGDRIIAATSGFGGAEVSVWPRHFAF